MNKNKDIRGYAKEKNVFLYEVAEVLSISEPTIMRRLRVELSDEEKCSYYAAIDRVAAEHAVQIAAASAK